VASSHVVLQPEREAGRGAASSDASGRAPSRALRGHAESFWRAARAHPWRALEVLAALALTSILLSERHVRVLWWKLLGALARGGAATVALAAVDPGTMRDALVVAAMFGLAVAPLGRLAVRLSPARRVWLPLLAFPTTVALALLPLAMTTPSAWIVLVVASVGGWLAASRPRLAWLAIAPVLVAVHPTLTVHSGPLSWGVRMRARLAARCGAPGRQLPRGIGRDAFHTTYYGLTRFDASRLLLTGEDASWWLRPEGSGLAVAGPAVVRGNLWTGAVGAERLWFTHTGSDLVEVDPTHAGDPIHERREVRFPWGPDKSELDLLDAVYDADTDSLLSTEMVGGGLWQYARATKRARHHRVGHFYLQAARRDDGQVVAIDTTDLYVFDPRTGAVSEALPVALGSGGLDVCGASGDVAVADYAGRIRLFSRDGTGRYRFTRSAATPAPRRVAFSPDCAFLTLTSADDTTVEVLRSRDLRVVRRYALGPGLRDATYLDARRVGVVDACTVTIVHGGA
jgi:hypothetical protein